MRNYINIMESYHSVRKSIKAIRSCQVIELGQIRLCMSINESVSSLRLKPKSILFVSLAVSQVTGTE